MSWCIVIIENNFNPQIHYYDYLDLLRKMLATQDKETVDNLFNLQFSLFFNKDIVSDYQETNNHQIKILSRFIYRESLDNLLQSTWFLRKKHCFVAISKEDIRHIITLKHISNLETPNAIFSANDWDEKLKATVILPLHFRLIQVVIKPLFIWWVKQVTPQIFPLYETKRILELQIKQFENIKLFEKKQLSNSDDSFLSLEKINAKLESDKSKLIIINELLQKEGKLLIEHWKNEPVFNVEINNTLNYIQNVTPHSELIKPLWKILNSIPEHPENCQKLKDWLLERELCLKNDEFLWR